MGFARRDRRREIEVVSSDVSVGWVNEAMERYLSKMSRSRIDIWKRMKIQRGREALVLVVFVDGGGRRWDDDDKDGARRLWGKDRL